MRRLRRLYAQRDIAAELKLAAKMTLGGTVAWWLATLGGAPQPIFAALVPLVAMTGDPFSAVSVSLARILGVFAGVGIGIALTDVPLGTTALVALALAAGTVAGIVLRVGERANIEAAISALFILAFSSASPAHAGITRVWETAVGAVVAVAVASLVWPPHPVQELDTRLRRLRRELVDDFAAVADDLDASTGAAASRLDDIRAHSLEAVRDVFELDRARNAMRWNPRRRRDAAALDEAELRISLGARLYRHARSLARDVADMGSAVTGTASGRRLAAATRDVAEAASVALDGGDPGPVLDRVEQTLSTGIDGAGALLAMQLRQTVADVRERL